MASFGKWLVTRWIRQPSSASPAATRLPRLRSRKNSGGSFESNAADFFSLGDSQTVLVCHDRQGLSCSPEIDYCANWYLIPRDYRITPRELRVDNHSSVLAEAWQLQAGCVLRLGIPRDVSEIVPNDLANQNLVVAYARELVLRVLDEDVDSVASDALAGKGKVRAEGISDVCDSVSNLTLCESKLIAKSPQNESLHESGERYGRAASPIARDVMHKWCAAPRANAEPVVHGRARNVEEDGYFAGGE